MQVVEMPRLEASIAREELSILRRVFETIDGLGYDEVKVSVGLEGLTIRDLDPARIMMVDAVFNKDFFMSFVGEETVFILPISRFTKFLKSFDEGISIVLDKDNLILSTEKPYNKVIHIPVVTDEDLALSSRPEVKFKGYAVLLLPVLRDILDASSKVTKEITIQIEIGDNRKCILFTAVDEMEGYKVSNRLCYPEHLEVIEIEGESVASKYSIQPLHTFVKGMSKIRNVAHLSMGTNLPLCLEIEHPQYNSMITFYLAPKIE